MIRRSHAAVCKVRPPGVSKRPKRLLAECAEMLGTSAWRLSRVMNADPHAPKPCLVAGRAVKRYYDPEDVRLWWTQLNERNKQCEST